MKFRARDSIERCEETLCNVAAVGVEDTARIAARRRQILYFDISKMMRSSMPWTYIMMEGDGKDITLL